MHNKRCIRPILQESRPRTTEIEITTQPSKLPRPKVETATSFPVHRATTQSDMNIINVMAMDEMKTYKEKNVK